MIRYLAAFVIAVLGGVLTYLLTPNTVSDYSIVGPSLMRGFNKSRDFYIIYAFFAGYVLSFLALKRVRSTSADLYSQALINRLKTWKVNQQEVVLRGALLFAVLATAASSFKFLCGRLLGIEILTNDVGGALVVLLALGSFWVAWKYESSQLAKLLSQKSFRISVLLIPFLFFQLIPLFKSQTTAEMFNRQNRFLLVVATILFVANHVEIFIRSKKERTLLNSIPLLSAFAMILNARGFYSALPVLSMDHYHFGEYLLPYWLVNSMDVTLYREYLPAHGLINVLPMALGHFVWGEISAANVLAGQLLLLFLFDAIAITCFSLTTGPSIAFLIAAAFPVVRPVYLLNAAAFSFVIWVADSKKWFVGLLVAPIIFASATVIELAPGISASAAVLPLAIWVVVQSYKSSRLRAFIGLAIASSVIAVVFSALPIDWSGLFRSLRENSAANPLGYATPLIDSFSSVRSTLKEIFRSVSILIWPVVLCLIPALVRRHRGADHNLLFALTAFAFVIFGFVILKYSLGRIDPDGWSRSGPVTFMWLFGILPVLLFIGLKNSKAQLLCLVPVLVAALFVKGSFEIEGLHRHSSTYEGAISRIPDREKLKVVTEFGIGGAFAPAEFINELSALAKKFDELAALGYRVLIMNNENAIHFYLGQKPIFESGAYYNLAHPQQRERAAAQLRNETKIAAVVLPTLQLHDGVPFWLRTPEIAAEILRRPLDWQCLGSYCLLVQVENRGLNLSELKRLLDVDGFPKEITSRVAPFVLGN